MEEKNLHHHHLVPKRRGGADDETNLITLCQDCHALIHQTKSWSKLSELQKIGREKRRASGKQWTKIKYGWDFIDGKGVPNAREQKQIKKILEMREQGLSYNEITKDLNKRGIKTKTRKNLWNRNTVRKIIISSQKKS